MAKDFVNQITLAKVQKGDWLYTSLHPTDGGEPGLKLVSLENPTVEPGKARQVVDNVKANGERWLLFNDATRTTPRAGTTAAYRYKLVDGEPVPTPTYPVCPTCDAGEHEPACHTSSGAWTSMHKAREKLLAEHRANQTARVVKVDGVKVAETRHVEAAPQPEPQPKPSKPAGLGYVKADQLVAALTAILPLTLQDKGALLPMLQSVHFETRDDELVLVATDRYVLGTYRIEWDGGEVDALLGAEDARQLLAYAKKVKFNIPIELRFGERQLEAFDLERKVSYPLRDEAFVKWAALVPEPEPTDERFGVNPHFIGRFAKAAEKGDTMTLTLKSPLKPLRVEIGERFTGLIMPVRLPGVVRTDPATVERAREHTAESVAEAISADPRVPGKARAVHISGPEDVGLPSEEGAMAAAAAGAPGSTVVKQADGRVVVQNFDPELAGEYTTASFRRVRIAEDGEVTHLGWDRPEPQPVPEPAPADLPATGERCFQCKGYGLVRKYGAAKGDKYKTHNGALEAHAKGNAMTCPVCEGTGTSGLRAA